MSIKNPFQKYFNSIDESDCEKEIEIVLSEVEIDEDELDHPLYI